MDKERILKTDAALMLSFFAKNPRAQGTVCAPISEKQSIGQCVFVPWEEIAAGA